MYVGSNNKNNILIIGVILFIVIEIAFSLFILINSTQNLTPTSDKQTVASEFVRVDKAGYEKIRKEKFQQQQ